MDKNLKINRITVKSFRGISKEQYLDLSDVTILYGENGTGKSSFVNAFEYIFSNELDNLKRDTIDSEKSTVHKDCRIEDMDIELKFKKKNSLKLTEEPLEGTLMESIKNDFFLNNASFILNRRKLLKFISGTQKDRYDALTELCGFEQLNKYRNTLNTVNNSIGRELKKKEKEYSTKITELASILNLEGEIKLDDIIDKTNILLEKNNLPIIDDLSNVEKLHSDFSLTPKKDEVEDNFKELEGLYGNLNTDKLSDELENLLKPYEKIASENLKSSKLLLNSLDNAYNYIYLEKPSKCPICNSQIDSDVLLENINTKVIDLKDIIIDLENWSNELNDFKDTVNRLSYQLEKIEDISLNLNELNDNYSILDFSQEKDNLKKLIKDLDDLRESKILLSEILLYDFSVINQKIEDLLKDFENYKSNRSPFNEELEMINKSLSRLETIEEIIKEIGILNKKVDLSSKTLKSYQESKEEFINNVIFEIKEDVKRYYNYIHGNDGINNPDIELTDESKMDVYLESFGERVDSRSFASEGHLDTLGLCIFLAFNKKYNKIPLIILDDVVATVDSPHKGKIAKLLVTELPDNQLFITTHSRLWAEQVKHIARANKVSHRIYEIIDWNLKEGPVLAKPLDTEEKIEKYLSTNHLDLNAAGNAARRYLEFNLKEICILNKIKVPIAEKYDVGTLFDDCKNSILGMVEGTDFEGYYNEIFSNSDETKHIANLLSHDNEEFYELSRNDVQSFCYSILNFRKAFTCSDCGKGLLKFDSDSKKLICINPKCQRTVELISQEDSK